MGLTNWSKFWRHWLRENYAAAFSDAHAAAATAIVADVMTVVKGKPDWVRTVGDYKRYITGWAKRQLRDPDNAARVLVFMVDRGTPIPKRVHCYPNRYRNAIRMQLESKEDEKESGSLTALSVGDDAAPLFDRTSPACAPFIVEGEVDVKSAWAAFIANGDLVKRELYPLIAEAFCDPNYYTPVLNESVVLHGLPFLVDDELGSVYPTGIPVTQEMHDNDPDLCNRVIFISLAEDGSHVRRSNWRIAQNRVREADLGIVFYEELLKAHPGILVWINDSDAIPILLLNTYDRRHRARENQQPHITLKMPASNLANRRRAWAKRRSDRGNVDDPRDMRPADVYVDIDRLYDLIECDDGLWGGSVYNRTLSLALLMVLTGTDFMSGFGGGLNVEKYVVPTFFEHRDLYACMVMLTTACARDTQAKRIPFLDEQLFWDFTLRCYAAKYNKVVVKAQRTGSSVEEALRAHCGSLKRETWHLPSRERVRVMGRHATWNLAYWLCGHRHPEAFKEGGDLYPLLRGEKRKVEENEGGKEMSEEGGCLHDQGDSSLPKGEDAKEKEEADASTLPTHALPYWGYLQQEDGEGNVSYVAAELVDRHQRFVDERYAVHSVRRRLARERCPTPPSPTEDRRKRERAVRAMLLATVTEDSTAEEDED